MYTVSIGVAFSQEPFIPSTISLARLLGAYAIIRLLNLRDHVEGVEFYR